MTLFSPELAIQIKEETKTKSSYLSPSKIEGETILRFFGEGIHGWEAWAEEDGKKHPVRWAKRPETLPETIRQEKGKSPLKKFIAAVCYDYTDQEFKLFSATQATVITAIMDLAGNKAWGDPATYDLMVRKEGKDLLTKYTVLPQPKEPVPAPLAKEYAALGWNLQALYDNEDPFGAAA